MIRAIAMLLVLAGCVGRYELRSADDPAAREMYALPPPPHQQPPPAQPTVQSPRTHTTINVR